MKKCSGHFDSRTGGLRGQKTGQSITPTRRASGGRAAAVLRNIRVPYRDTYPSGVALFLPEALSSYRASGLVPAARSVAVQVGGLGPVGLRDAHVPTSIRFSFSYLGVRAAA